MPNQQPADQFHAEGYFIAEDAIDPKIFDDRWRARQKE